MGLVPIIVYMALLIKLTILVLEPIVLNMITLATLPEIDSLPIDVNRPRVKMIGADDTYTYVRAENANYKLYAINKLTK